MTLMVGGNYTKGRISKNAGTVEGEYAAPAEDSGSESDEEDNDDVDQPTEQAQPAKPASSRPLSKSQSRNSLAEEAGNTTASHVTEKFTAEDGISRENILISRPAQTARGTRKIISGSSNNQESDVRISVQNVAEELRSMKKPASAQAIASYNVASDEFAATSSSKALKRKGQSDSNLSEQKLKRRPQDLSADETTV